MRIANDERLSVLKEYARKHFRLTRNVRVLVLLVSEEETRVYRELAAREIETTPVLKEFIKSHPPDLASHERMEILSNEACAINAKRNLQINVLRKLIVTTKTKIPNFDKYGHVILIREELLEALGKKHFPTPEGRKANFAELAFGFLLCHEFLHIAEDETGIRIYDGTKKEDVRVSHVLNHLPQKYWEKGVQDAMIQFQSE
jgi:hypothetical protein